jgi:alkanesulfonate monooxygenase SsuD/methylene tetrahydromethanopterin reductase-like flavin-dependent oxidoreductase (luciferase family)
MRFSAWPIVQQPAADFLDICRHAERTGWDGVWISDHLMPSRPPPS